MINTTEKQDSKPYIFLVGQITPFSLPEKKDIGKHRHEFIFYDGCLGYASYICLKCGCDINDLKEIKK